MFQTKDKAGGMLTGGGTDEYKLPQDPARSGVWICK